MTTKNTTIISIILIVIAIVAGAVLWNQLPDQMASHWNSSDQVDDTMPKFWGVFLMPMITLGMMVLLLVLPGIDTFRANIAQFRATCNDFTVLIIAFMLYVHGLTLALSLGFTDFKMSSSMLPFMGVLFISIGSLLRKAKRNFFIGIRTPWTLSSDYVWDKTHQLGATLFMVSGAFAIIGGLFGGMIAFWFLFVPMMGSTLFLMIYSYVLYRRETKGQ